MARIIEYNEGEYGEGRGSSSGGAALLVVVILILLYFSGYMPWFTNASTVVAPRGLVAGPAAELTIPVGNIGYVTADRLNMRTAPTGPVTYILPRGTRVTFMGESYRQSDGDVWTQVRIETYEGLQVGWVNRRYIS